MGKSKLSHHAGNVFRLLIISCLLILHSCSDSKKATSLSPDEFEKKLTENPVAQLIDVRSPEEYAEGHLKGAKNFNVNSFDFSGGIGGLDKTKPVFVYCMSGNRSETACSKIIEAGFKEVYELNGGKQAWVNAGKAVETGAEALPAANGKGGMSEAAFYKILTDNHLVLVDFNATWCGPCKEMVPILQEIENEYKTKIKVLSIDVDENTILATAMKVEALPTLQIYKNGKKSWENVGSIDKTEIVKELK